jgi:putative addiction module CopG family antidote
MQLDLTPEQTTFVDLGIREGRFANREEAVRQALAQWERRERERAQLVASLEAADASLDAGEGEIYEVDQLSLLTESIRRRGHERLKQRA